MNDNPEYDGTDFAHPAWWRGHQAGFDAAMPLIERALTEKPAGKIGNARWQTLRERVYALAKSGAGGPNPEAAKPAQND